MLNDIEKKILFTAGNIYIPKDIALLSKINTEKHYESRESTYTDTLPKHL